jgi:dihydropteroate synthase
MTRFLRPLGFISGSTARAAVEQGRALPLAGGPLAFTLVEIIERAGPGRVARHIVPIDGARDALMAHTAARSPIGSLNFDRPAVMGVVNATPDSFSDGGAFIDPARAIAHAEALIASGAHILDIGGESTRPGAVPVEPAEEIRRIVPIIEGIRAQARAAGVIVSVDTRHAATMRAALEIGADMINDVSALSNDIDTIPELTKNDVPIVLMHMQGEPQTMQKAPAYDDVALDVYEYLQARIAACEAAGIVRSRLIADPGIGFGKSEAHNLALLEQLSLFHGLGVPLLIGVSRKGFIGRLSGAAPPDRRLPGSLAAGLAAIGQGAQILRVHDVAETVQALRVATAISL